METQNTLDIKRFLDVKRINDASEATIKNQEFILNQFNKFINSKPFRKTAEEDVFGFLTHKKENGSSYLSLLTYKIILKSFYRFLYGLPRHKYPRQVENLNGSSNHKRRVPIRPEDVVTKEDIVFLIKHCENYRDEALVVTLYESGCRLGEFINISIGHLKFDKKGMVLLVSGKSGERRVRLIESVPYLQKWLENHPRKDERSAPLWVTRYGRITEGGVQNVLKRLKKRSGFKKPLNPHAFRHSRLTELAKYLPDAKLKIFAGWTGSSTMTRVYVHLSGEDLDDDLLKIAGVQVEEKPKVSPLLERECPRCKTKNPANNTFCGLCGLILDETKAVTEELEVKKIRDELTEIKGRYLIAGEITDQLWDTIDSLKKEVEELKKRQ